MRENFVRFFSPNAIQKELLIYSDGMGYESNPSFFINRTGFQNYLILYNIFGKLWCHQNGNIICVNPGESVLLDLHLPHQYYFEKNVPSKIAWVHMNGTPMVPLMQRIESKCTLPMKVKLPLIYDHMISLFELSDQLTPDVFLQSEECYSLLLLFLRAIPQNLTGHAENDHFQEFKKNVWHIIAHNLHRNITLNELAQNVSLSKYHFARTFQSAFGISPMRFITEEKIRQAKHRLLYTAEPIYRISDALGFTTPEYFSKVFKQYVGCTPLEYRNSGAI